MSFWRKDRAFPTSDYSDSQILWEQARRSMKEKSDHNKSESQICFLIVIVLSVGVPIFIAFGQDVLWGKIVPSILTACVAAASSWLQLRQPQRLWLIYRRAQRLLECEKIWHDNLVRNYENCERPDAVLSDRVSEILIATQLQWEGVVPSAEAIGSLSELKQPEVSRDVT